MVDQQRKRQSLRKKTVDQQRRRQSLRKKTVDQQRKRQSLRRTKIDQRTKEYMEHRTKKKGKHVRLPRIQSTMTTPNLISKHLQLIPAVVKTRINLRTNDIHQHPHHHHHHHHH
ncbi:hypothetical protein BCR42DRAFT_416787 [Absidia repens]|uniref:Uncharacterized protein n=1 Tax=Absidia repens TaxID=90262 RepID=A0A1X2IEZ3_9FUNG|nr:hypothetical protein BCR42DRAFT_416787 [Absidia repens]